MHSRLQCKFEPNSVTHFATTHKKNPGQRSHNSPPSDRVESTREQHHLAGSFQQEERFQLTPSHRSRRLYNQPAALPTGLVLFLHAGKEAPSPTLSQGISLNVQGLDAAAATPLSHSALVETQQSSLLSLTFRSAAGRVTFCHTASPAASKSDR